MKNAINALILSLVAFSLVSCCTTCGKEAKPAVVQGTTATTLPYNTTHIRYENPAPVPATVVAEAPVDTCPKCTERYSADGCCGNTVNTYAERATTQGWDGNPFIGLLPTMKPLAE